MADEVMDVASRKHLAMLYRYVNPDGSTDTVPLNDVYSLRIYCAEFTIYFSYIPSVLEFDFNLYVVICLHFIYLYVIAIHYTSN